MRGPDLLASDDMRFLRDLPHRSSRGEAGKAESARQHEDDGHTRNSGAELVLVPIPAAPATTPPAAAVPIAAPPVTATPVAAAPVVSAMPVVAAMPVGGRRKGGPGGPAPVGGGAFFRPG